MIIIILETDMIGTILNLKKFNDKNILYFENIDGIDLYAAKFFKILLLVMVLLLC